MAKKYKITGHKLTLEEDLGITDADNLIVLSARLAQINNDIAFFNTTVVDLNVQKSDIQTLINSIV